MMSLRKLLSAACTSMLIATACSSGTSQGSPAAGSPTSGSGSGAQASKAPPVIGDLVQPGKLIIVTTGKFAPFSFLDANGKLQGYSIDLAAELAKRLGLQLETPTVDFVAILQGVSSGRYDMSDVGIWPTKERQALFLWTVPLASDGTVATVRFEDKDRLPALTPDLKGLQGLRISAAQGSAQEQWLLDNQKAGGYTVVSNPGLPIAIQALKNKQTDIEAGDSLAVAYYNAQSPGVIATIGQPIIAHPLSAAMRVGAPQLFAASNGELKKMVADGTVAKLQKKWFGQVIPTPTDINQSEPFPLPPGS